LWIQQTDRSYSPHHGYLHTVRRLGSDSGLTSYQLVFASWMHFLRFRHDARIWQDQTVEGILTDVFNAHPQAQGAFRFTLQNALPQRSFCVQYEDDWNFCHRLMENEGLFAYFEQSSDGKSHTLVVTDNLESLNAVEPQTVDFYRAGSGSETDAFVQWAGTRTLQSARLKTRTFDYKDPGSAKSTDVPTLTTQGDLPPQTEVYEYTGSYTYLEPGRGDQLSRIRMEEWESRAKRFFGSGSVRRIDTGRWFELSGHPEHDKDPAEQRQFAVLAVDWFIENNLPVSSPASDFPHSLKRTIAEARARHTTASSTSAAVAAAAGMTSGLASALASSADANSAGGDGFFLAEVESQRKTVAFRSPLEHRKPEMPMQTATVVGPSNEEVYTDSLNRVKVQMHWDRLNPGDEKASCWLRAASSHAGQNFGGVFAPRIGQEVVVSYLDGDCDRPIITGRVYNTDKAPHWHSNGLLSGYKSKEFKGDGFNQLVMDDATGQNRTQLFSSQSNSQLHLGYLIEQTGNTRGAFLGTGFDLKSDAYGALRAGKGLYVSTHPGTGNASQPLDASDSRGQLSSAGSVLDSMSSASVAHQAESLQAGTDALKHFTAATQSSAQGALASSASSASSAPSGAQASGSGSANVFSEPIMLFGSPNGIGAVTQRSVHVAADQQVNLVSGQSVHLAAGKSLLASVTEKISFFVQNAGIKLFAAKGKVEIQAQGDNLELTAQKAVKLVSVTDNIEASASQGILLTAGGAYIRIANGNIEIHAPGKVDIKGAQHAFSGPTRLDETYNMEGKKGDLRIKYVDADGAVPPGEPIQLAAGDGTVHSVVLDGAGKGELNNIDYGQLVANQSKRS
jgi:type VI secretion system secreted protein VgrG